MIKSRITIWSGHVTHIGIKERRVQDFGRKTCGKETIWKTQPRWEDNIKIDLQELGRGGMDWIDLAHDRDNWPALVNAIMNKMRTIS